MPNFDFSNEIAHNTEFNLLKVSDKKIDELLRESDLTNPRYVESEKLNILLKNKKWMGTALEFIWLLKQSKSSIKPRGSETAILGMSAHAVRYSIGEMFEASGWEKLYQKYNIDASGSQTELFMERLVADDEIKNIVFLVPDNLFSYEENDPESPSMGITRREFQYLLDHPDTTNKVLLVFGGHDSINKEKIEETGAVDKYGVIADGVFHTKIENDLQRQFGHIASEMSGDNLKRIKFENTDEMYGFMDGIPGFQLDYNLLDGIKEDSGRIPHLFEWFSEGKQAVGEKSVSAIRYSKNYIDWGIGKELLELTTGWKEKNYDIPFFINPESRKILSKWESKGLLEDYYMKIARDDINGHLVRLLTHKNAPACSDFAVAVMNYLPKISDEELRSVYDIHHTDGNEQALFWTFAPYIFESLRQSRLEKGLELNDYDDFLRVLSWLKSRKKTGIASADYPGIVEFKYYAYDLYLPQDGNHRIHKLVASVGAHIASYLEKMYTTERLLFDKTRARKSEKIKY